MITAVVYQALAKTEDETDAVAVEQVKAEQKEELAEFDENIPWEEGERRDEESHVEQELAMLDKEVNIVICVNVGTKIVLLRHLPRSFLQRCKLFPYS